MIINLNQMVTQCAPHVAPSTMIAIIKTESKGNPFAIGLNKGKKLRYQPKNLAQAIAWVNYLEKYNYNFDIGLAQVNIKNVHKYGFKAADMLDTCKNLQVASDILRTNYHTALNNRTSSNTALLKAISAYNTGNYQSGFSNGYVSRVIANAGLNVNKTRIDYKAPTVIQSSTERKMNVPKRSMVVYARSREEIEATN